MTQLCEILHVSRSAYYAWRHDEPGTRRREDNRLRPMIRGIFREHRRRYGTRRIVAELDARRESCGRRRAARLMEEMELRFSLTHPGLLRRDRERAGHERPV